MESIERALYYIVDESDDHNKLSKFFNYFLMGLIILSVGEMALETDDSIYIPYKKYFDMFDFFTVMVFSTEYIIRILTAHLADPDYSKHQNRAKSIARYIFSFGGIVDLVSIIPYYLTFTSIDLRVLRSIRLLRFFRVFKIARYNSSIDLIIAVIREKRSELSVVMGLIIIVMIIASFMMYYAEHEYNKEMFSNVLSCFWWSIVTLTTIGYGDVFPVTFIGKIVGSLMAILGIGLVAMPTGIISAGFLEKINEKAKEKEKEKAIQEAKAEKENKASEISDEKKEKQEEEKKHYCPYCGKRLD